MNILDKNEIHIYNQNVFNEFSSDCTIVTWWQIIWLTYDVWLEYKTLDKIVDYMIKIWKLFNWWASFSVIYWAMSILFSKRIKENINVYKTSIYSNDFVDHLKQWYFFWLWLKNWNPRYLNIVRNWDKITKADVDKIKADWWWFWHNHCYWYYNWKYYIFEIYLWTMIEMPLEVLRYAVGKDLYYEPARTFKLENKTLEKYLFNYKNWIVTENVQDLPKEDRLAITKASMLRVFKDKWNYDKIQ